jgi:hypothetical protein
MAGKEWSLERVVNELRQLHAGGQTLTYGALRAAGFSDLVAAAERHVGSFSRAVRLAGIEPSAPRWTPMRVLAEIRRLHRDGASLNSQQMRGGGLSGLVAAARKHFGAWPSAVLMAGVPRFKRGRWTTWKQMRDQLRELQARGVRMSVGGLKADGHAALVEAASRAAGGWRAALAKAGIQPVAPPRHQWTREQVLAEIRALHKRGVVLSSGQLMKSGKRKLVRAARQYFGSWGAACQDAIPGHAPLARRWTMDQLLDRIRARHREGHSIRSTDVLREEPTLTAAAWRLGVPWRKACARAGIPAAAISIRKPKTRIRWKRPQLIEKLRTAARSGRPLLGKTFTRGFVQVLIRRFGSWLEALRAAGLTRRYAADLAAARAKRYRPDPRRRTRRRRTST